MPSYVIKVEKETDFYVYWSDIVEAPKAYGPREYIRRYLMKNATSAEVDARLKRADELGTSAQWPNKINPIYGWNDETLIYQQQGILKRSDLIKLCNRLDENEYADVSDLLEPFED